MVSRRAKASSPMKKLETSWLRIWAGILMVPSSAKIPWFQSYCRYVRLMLILYHRGLPRLTCTPHIQGHEYNIVESLVVEVFGNTLWRTLQVMCFPSSAPHAWGKFHFWKKTPRAWNHRWWLGRSLWRRVTGCCAGPSIRTSWLNTCSQRQGDAKSVLASGQAPGLVILGPTLASSSSNISWGIRMKYFKDRWS